MSRLGKILQIAFTYIGTIVGAGFATGQEILQFFTRFGGAAVFTIAFASFLFVWLGTKIMLLAQQSGARSYDELNGMLFGKAAGKMVSFLTLFILFGICAVMLAGVGSIFREQLHFPYLFGQIATLLCVFVVLMRGIDAILAINSVVVPAIVCFSLLTVVAASSSANAHQWISLPSNEHPFVVWMSPILYLASNLILAQAVLVPIGSAIADRSVLRWGGIVGGVGIGLLLLASHFAMSAQMPAIKQFEIPMGAVLIDLGRQVQLIYIILILAEIFTTLIANVFGITRQLEEKFRLHPHAVMFAVLVIGFFISQVGFSKLLTTLYPLFGVISLGWLFMMMRKKTFPG
jgi:uncharacterized membrane protein YkvI